MNFVEKHLKFIKYQRHAQAVRKLWKGKNTIFTDLYGQRVLLRTIRKAGNGLLVEAKQTTRRAYSEEGEMSQKMKKVLEEIKQIHKKTPAPKAMHLVFYPQPEDSRDFAETTAGLLGGEAPHEHFPGAVGVMKYFEHEGGFKVVFIQGCFKQKKPLTAKVQRQYANWRHHLLDEFFSRVNKSNNQVVSYSEHVDTKVESTTRTQDFEKLATKHGFEAAKARFPGPGRLNTMHMLATKKQ